MLDEDLNVVLILNLIILTTESTFIFRLMFFF